MLAQPQIESGISEQPEKRVLFGGADPKLRRAQMRIFWVTWAAYFAVYLTRKPISVTKSTLEDDLHLSPATLALYDVGYLSTYAAGQFLNGWLADRLGARMILATGLIGSGLCCISFSFMTDPWVLGVIWSLNGIFQSSAWPGCIKAITPWFATRDRGFLMGWWSTCYALGGIVGTLLSTAFLSLQGWESAFLFPGIIVLIVGVVTRFSLTNHPSDIGLISPYDAEIGREQIIDRDIKEDAPILRDSVASVSSIPSGGINTEKGDNSRISFIAAIRLPGVIDLCIAYFCVKLIVSSLFFWLPYYLDEEVGYSSATAGYVSAMLDAGGSLGSIATGYASDRWLKSRRILVVVPCFIMSAGSMWLYLLLGGEGVVFNSIILALVGFFIFGPDSLLAGAAAQDIGGRSSATVAGLINGVGSIGAILQGPVTSFTSNQYGWQSLFYLLMIMCGACCLSLSRMLIVDIRKYRLL